MTKKIYLKEFKTIESKNMYQVMLMYALFGSIFSVGKMGLEGVQPYFLTSMRMLLAGIILLALHRIRNKELFCSMWRIVKQERLLFLSVAFFNVFVTNAFEFWGLQYMSAGKTCLIYSLSPFAAVFIGYFFGFERMTVMKLVGLLIGISAFVPMMVDPWMVEESGKPADAHFFELLAQAALMVSAITAVIGWTFVKQLTVEKGLCHVFVNGATFTLAGIMSLLASMFVENWHPVPVTIWKEFLYALLYIVVIHNLICYSIYASALKRFSVSFMAFAGLTNPLFAAFFGWILLGENVGLPFWTALVGVFCGLYIFYREEKRDFGNVQTELAN